MRMYDLIVKKRDNKTLAREEISYMIQGYVKDEIPDYQMAAMLMAIYFQGMTDEELADLTDIMAHSGDMVDLSEISGITVDKHSTGGVGDKTTLIAAPIAAACGVRIAKMSGRGLGHTGGTVDKLESIPGYQTSIERTRFIDIVKRHGISVIGQSGNLAPADKKIYALRDVTATVESIPLIAASIMSKKLAAGSDCILLDVKVGSGAFMKTSEDAVALAQKMSAIGERAGRRVTALITDMDLPLGNCIGNSLEVAEAAETLQGRGPDDLTRICIELAAHMMELAGIGTVPECKRKAKKAIENGTAMEKFAEMVTAQGGDASVLYHPELFQKASILYEVKAEKDGYIVHMDAQECGAVSCILGAGRETKESRIDFSAGIVMRKKTGDKVTKGETVAVLHTSRKDLAKAAAVRLLAAVEIEEKPPEKIPLILAVVDRNGVRIYQDK
ncbi:pyrimidine-nucleoside phosphorylase [Ruminococcus sp. OA3]|uniref:pyrimidine-nucleoside phosphorylase n=1 Tax=Ruminococcus sp. OA3 TaxID=2914164 RepID=UPI001F062837|nr:pyrimidine-nucleoside phosphorylase [Ruminococcus sp. OA3]MCH1984317.1 pyrimidine-nucleoside phosphorylase [Ruminococcus sp. OA3]